MFGGGGQRLEQTILAYQNRTIDGAQVIAELERLAGKQALEIEILKKAGSLLGSLRNISDRNI